MAPFSSVEREENDVLDVTRIPFATLNCTRKVLVVVMAQFRRKMLCCFGL